MSKCLVVSAVNFCEGGPLTVLRDCLYAATVVLPADWRIVALVHDRRLFDIPRVEFLEFPASKKSWLRRLYYEFWRFNALSEQLRPNVWFSLHDISPRVTASRQVVYCHNPSPFFRMPWRELLLDPKFFLFTRFYRYLYRLNIRANDLVVVQQDWIRREFKRMYPVREVVVAYPVGTSASMPKPDPIVRQRRDVFLYPSLPRTFKNFTVLCEAAQMLHDRLGACFEVRLTVDGKENSYAAAVHAQYGSSAVVKLIGRQTVQQMARQYQECSAVVFPSLLETWGLPISEGKQWGKTLLLADLPYAHEAVGDYSHAAFFDPKDSSQLAELMYRHMSGELVCKTHMAPQVEYPFAPDWQSLLKIVVDN